MSLQITLSPETETRLREQAAANGRDAADYASQLVEQGVLRAGNGKNRDWTSDEEQKRLHEIARRLIERAKYTVADPNPPKLRDQEAEISDIIVEKFRKQGFKL